MGYLKVEMQDFAEITSECGLASVSRRFDGVLGMGHDKSAVNRMVPPFYNMLHQDLLDEPVLAFYFGNSKNGKGDEAEVTLGGIDRNHYTGEMVKLPLRRKFNWEVELNAVTFGEETIELDNTGAAIDTGTSLIGLPTHLAESMYGHEVSFDYLQVWADTCPVTRKWVLRDTPMGNTQSSARSEIPFRI